MKAMVEVLNKACRWLRMAGPYLLVVLVMPGGSLVALTVLLARRGRLDPWLSSLRLALRRRA